MRALVTSSRDWADVRLVREKLAETLARSGGTLTVVHGDCPTGGDAIAAEWVAGFHRGVSVPAGFSVTDEPHPADWTGPCRPECAHGPRLRRRDGADYGTDEPVKKDTRFYERVHRDDEWHDEIRITTVPRYKTSGLSGDEWHVSARVELKRKGRIVYERDYGRIEYAVLHLPWLLATYAEQEDGIDVHLTADLCMQPGCSEPWTTVYRKKADGCWSCGEMKPEDESYPHYRAFCARHARRGDCGRDDADRNYEVVEGIGPDGPGKRSTDESPSAFGGVIVLGEPDEPAGEPG